MKKKEKITHQKCCCNIEQHINEQLKNVSSELDELARNCGKQMVCVETSFIYNLLTSNIVLKDYDAEYLLQIVKPVCDKRIMLSQGF